MDVSFELFCKLIFRLGHPPLSTSPGTSSKPHLPPGKIFASWLAHLPRPLTPGTGKILFRLLFPHEGSRRRYALKEYRLAQELEAVLGLRGLGSWDQVVLEGSRQRDAARDEGAGSGCLGLEVKRRVKERHPKNPSSGLSIAQLDVLLDALAAHSPFSQLSQPQPSGPSANSILATLYRDFGLSPFALAVLTQIILRDLRPLLSPLPKLNISNPTAMLALTSTSGPDQLSLYEAMNMWDTKMLSLWRGGKGSLDWCADMAECLATTGSGLLAVPSEPASSKNAAFADLADGPMVGLNVPIPKCRKGRSVSDALSPFLGTSKTPAARTVWAETKYDGYRMQIHVAVDGNDAEPRITIYSKSTRNATLERGNTHSIVWAALGLSIHGTANARKDDHLLRRLQSEPTAPKTVMSKGVILEAEVVPYNEGQREGGRGPGIEEFWWLEAAGVTVSRDELGLPSIWRHKRRHLCLVFFDILHLDGRNLLREPYVTRRKVLEEAIRPIAGYSMLAERIAIDLEQGRQHALSTLDSAFGVHCALHQEGLVLKAGDSAYMDNRWPWVKLKKDYIPNLGDCVDLVVLGAGWDVDRARELRVNTSVFTTFYLGVLTNPERTRARAELPHFEILFRCSYGPDRTQLELYNHSIRSDRWRSKPYDKTDPFKRRLLGLSWTYRLGPGMPAPSVFFETPLCAEVMGAGFLRLPNADGESERWEVRFPRLMKVWEHAERPWTEALDARGLVSAVHAALGYVTEPTTSPEHDSIRRAWRTSIAVTLTDIPELPTPTAPPRSTPRSARHAKSAPGSFAITKTSPSTPSPTRGEQGSEMGRQRVPLSAAKRLIRVTQEPAQGGAALVGDARAMGKRKGVLDSSPLASPPKRVRGAERLTPPPSSPSHLGNDRQPLSPVKTARRTVVSTSGRRKRKALSLYTRVRSALSQRV